MNSNKNLIPGFEYDPTDLSDALDRKNHLDKLRDQLNEEALKVDYYVVQLLAEKGMTDFLTINWKKLRRHYRNG